MVHRQIMSPSHLTFEHVCNVAKFMFLPTSSARNIFFFLYLYLGHSSFAIRWFSDNTESTTKSVSQLQITTEQCDDEIQKGLPTTATFQIDDFSLFVECLNGHSQSCQIYTQFTDTINLSDITLINTTISEPTTQRRLQEQDTSICGGFFSCWVNGYPYECGNFDSLKSRWNLEHTVTTIITGEERKEGITRLAALYAGPWDRRDGDGWLDGTSFHTDVKLLAPEYYCTRRVKCKPPFLENRANNFYSNCDLCLLSLLSLVTLVFC